MTSGSGSEPNPTPEEMSKAFTEILDYITPLITANQDAVWETHCPHDIILEGTKDDAWREGQKNGEIHAARQILSILGHALGTAPITPPHKEPTPKDQLKGIFPDL